MKTLRNILVLVLMVTFVTIFTGCNSGGGRAAILETEDWCLGCVEIDPIGVNINDKNSTELLTIVREEELQDTVIKLSRGKKPVITNAADVTTATGTASLMGTAFGPRPKIIRARK